MKSEPLPRKSWLLLVVLLTLSVGFLFLPLRQWFLQAQSTIESFGVLAPLFVIAVYVILTILLIPGSALTLAASALFGFWQGLLIVLTGANLGALASFLLARTLMRKTVTEWAAANPRFAALDRAIAANGFKMVLLTRLSPVFPFTLLNYLLGLTAVRTNAYVLANLLGMLPGTFLYVYLGATANSALSTPSAQGSSTLQWIWRSVGLLATIAIVVFLTRAAQRALVTAENTAVAEPPATPQPKNER